MALDASCVTENIPWSIITSAATNSSLAAVLAGLLLAAIAVLYAENTYEGHTIALFAVGVVVLALDSYLFSHLTGIKPISTEGATGGDRIAAACERAWLQSAPASGMLAVGAVALVCGLAWMMATYVVEKRAVRDPFLPFLGWFIVQIVILIVTLLLASTSVQSLGVVWPGLPTWAAAVVCFGYAALVTGLSLRYSLRPMRTLRSAIEHSTSAVVLDKTTRFLKWSTLAAASFALIGPFFAGSISLYTEWIPWEWANGLLVLILGLVYPGGVSVLMSRALPSI